MQGSAQEKKKTSASTQKTLKISKKFSPKTSETVNGLSRHKFQDLWDRGSTTTTTTNNNNDDDNRSIQNCMLSLAS